VRHSNVETGARLRLLFRAISTAELLELISHYNGQSGGFAAFAIPDDLLSGMTTPADFTPSGSQWIYASRPAVVDIPIDGTTNTNRHDVTVELASVPEQPAVYAPRLMLRLSVFPPEVTGTHVDVPAVAFTLAALAPSVESGGTDPHFADVVLLLPMDTDFADYSNYSRSITVVGDTQISTAQSKFSSASGYFDGSGDRLTMTTTTELQLTGDFTVEVQAYPLATADDIIIGNSSSNVQVFRLNQGGTGRLSVYVDPVQVFAATAGGITVNTWHHLALSRSGTETRMFVNGLQIGDARNLWSNTLEINRIGSLGIGGSSFNEFQGYLADLRITKGVGRYTGNFTPPTAPFPTS